MQQAAGVCIRCGLGYNGRNRSGEGRGNKGGSTLMKRFIKFATVALLVAALISRWRRVKELSRQVVSASREEPLSEDPGGVSPSTVEVSDVDEEPTVQADEPQSRVEATPAAERRAEELGVDLSRVEGTGSGGRIIVKDVQKAAEEL